MYYKYFKLTMCSSLFSVFFHNVNKLVLRIATGQSTMGLNAGGAMWLHWREITLAWLPCQYLLLLILFLVNYF